MVKSILIVGVGGQGTILMSKILTKGLVSLGYDVKMSEIHGMSQRGGSVTTQIKYSTADGEAGGGSVNAPNISEGEADIIVSFEKIEALRALPFLKKNGVIITDDREIFPMPVLTGAAVYPHDAIEELGRLCPGLKVIKAAEIAENLGSVRAQNIVLLGALIRELGLEDADWKALVTGEVPPKALDVNLAALEKGAGLV